MRLWITGPGRTGSSALAGLLHNVSPGELALPEGPWVTGEANPVFYEPHALVDFIHHNLGGFWVEGIEADPGPEAERLGRRLYHEAFPKPDSALWKTPGLSYSLRWWLNLVPVPHAIVVTFRDWGQIAASANAWNGTEIEASLANTVRVYRTLLADLAGTIIPWQIVDYRDTVTRPVWVQDRFVRFAGDNLRPDPARDTDLIDRSLDHHAEPRAWRDDVSAEDLALFDQLREMSKIW